MIEWPPFKVFAIHAVEPSARKPIPHMTQIVVASWLTPGGRLMIHYWRRGEDNPGRMHPHWAHFWTFPLRSYWELRFEGPRETPNDVALAKSVHRLVRAWRWHYRDKDTYHHNVLGRDDGKPFITITWHLEDRDLYDHWNRSEGDAAIQIWPSNSHGAQRTSGAPTAMG